MNAPARMLVTLTAEELESLVEKAVDRAMSRRSPTPEWLTREQTAEVLQVHPVMVTRYVKTRGLKGVHIGREWRFKKADIVAWLEAQGTEPGAPVEKYGRKLRAIKGGV